MADTFTKVVLAVIAIALCSISARLWMEPRHLTWADLRDTEGDERSAAYGRATVIRLQGGTTSVSVEQ